MAEGAQEEEEPAAIIRRKRSVATSALFCLTTVREDRLLNGLCATVVKVRGAVSEPPERWGPPLISGDWIAPIGR